MNEIMIRSIAIAKKVDCTAYDVWHSCSTEPQAYNCTIVDAVAAYLW